MSVFNELERRVEARMKKYKRVIVSYSAGKDSTVLLYLAKKIADDYGIELYAVHIDEGIAGHSDVSRRIAIKVAKELGVKLLGVSLKEYFGITIDELKPKFSLPPCAACGPMRRQLINDVGLRIGAPIFTGHNVNDDVETLIINMFRGERRRFLEPTGGPGMVPRETPFIDVSEETLEKAAEELGLPYKKEPCPYAKLSMRRKIIKHEMATRPKEKVIELQKVMRMIKAFHVTKLKSPRFCKYCGSPSASSVCRVCSIMKELGMLEERIRRTRERRKKFRIEDYIITDRWIS